MVTLRPFDPEVRVNRTVHQICTPDGLPHKGYATECVWVTGFDSYEKVDDSKVEYLVDGAEYFSQLADTIAAAESSVYILGWQISWDVMLKPDKGLRLYDAILNRAKQRPELKVYILPWKNPSFQATQSLQAEAALSAINASLARPQVFVERAAEHSAPSEGISMFFSHHQKQVVIDEKIAFLGGLDVAYGRRDDSTFSLNAKGRLGNDLYNGCVAHFMPINVGDYVDGKLVSSPDKRWNRTVWEPNPGVAEAKAQLAKPGSIEVPIDGFVLDAKLQPRMPWQDIHLRLEGPIVSDLAGNFVLRWNVARKKAELNLPSKPAAFAKKGSCSVQFLRSASDKMVALELKHASAQDKPRVHAEYGHNHIHHAMVRLIENAEHFIYIENQFFVSAFGEERFGDASPNEPKRDLSPEITFARPFIATRISCALPGDSTKPPRNKICEALGEKIKSVILDVGNPPPDGKNSEFHVYITLPVHPEGMLNDPLYMTQLHFTMQTLVFGTQSLLNRIRRAIKARQLRDADRHADYWRVYEDKNTEYKTVPIEQCWPYVTLLNLRNWAELKQADGTSRYVTEQIYIHSKMMVVDDRYAVVGSANVNDRSLLGDRDSEMAVLVMDTEHACEDVGATTGPTVTRKFARELRMRVWNKIFGNTGGVRPAGLEDAIKRPAAPSSWEAIRAQAEDNTRRYEAAFPYIPRNMGRNKEGEPVPASVWPTAGVEKGHRTGAMPFDAEFWATPRHTPAVAGLLSVKGYITLLPWRWTEGQNNNSYIHSAGFALNDPEPSDVPGQEPVHSASSDAPNPSKEMPA